MNTEASEFTWDSSIEALLPIEGIEECIETHLSLVFLTEKNVYKLKKPLNFTFVNYSTFTKRWEAACSEIYLNRRLTSDVYLGVRHIKVTKGALEWASEVLREPEIADVPTHGPDDNVAVVMRRLDDQFFLSNLIHSESFQAVEYIEPLVRRLKDFHKNHPASYFDETKYFEIFKENILDNYETLDRKVVPDEIRSECLKVLSSSKQYALKFLEEKTQLLKKRAKLGRVVDGHGDLRLEHICFEEGYKTDNEKIQIFDCIEFSRQIRCNDVASEIGFLSMDMDFNKRSDIAALTEKLYSEQSGDTDLNEILTHMKIYRALVRAKVHALRAAQLKEQQKKRNEQINISKRYISLASRYQFGIDKPILVLVCGLMGTGKTTLAAQLQDLLCAEYFNSDVIRKELYSDVTKETSSTTPYLEGIYSTEATHKTYDELYSRAKIKLKNNMPIIMDASFSKSKFRKSAQALARSTDAKLVIIECLLADEIVLSRITERIKDLGNISDGRPELFTKQKQDWENIEQGEADLVISINMDRSAEEVAHEIAQKISKLFS